MKHCLTRLGLVGFLVAGAAACGKQESPAPSTTTEAVPAPQAAAPTPTPVALAPADEAKALFTGPSGVCFACHGATGAGDGPAAGALNPKPRAYTDPAWQASVKDEEIANIIRVGGKAVGKSELMPPSPQLSAAVVDELVKIIRGFKQP